MRCVFERFRNKLKLVFPCGFLHQNEECDKWDNKRQEENMNSATSPLGRPSSEQLVDLHVYLVPKEVWHEKFRKAYNDVIPQTISAGFLRVWPERTLYYLRNEILEQLGNDVLPSEYVFLKSVGTCLTQVNSKQEFVLKVKNFVPPQVAQPELYVLEAKRDPLHLASFTNHERMEHLEEQISSSPVDQKEDKECAITLAGDPEQKESRQKRSKIPCRINQTESKVSGAQGSKQTRKGLVNQTGKPQGDKPRQAAGNRARPLGLGKKGIAGRTCRLPLATAGRGSQVAGSRNLAGDKSSRLNPGAKTAPNRSGQNKTARENRLVPSQGNRGLESKTRETRVKARLGLEAKQQASQGAVGKGYRTSAGISKSVRTEQEPTAPGRSSQAQVSAHTNHPDSPGSTQWALQQSFRSSFGDSHRQPTTPTPSQTPNLTPGRVPPLHPRHLDDVKGVEGSTPLRSGRPDTYTNNTNEDSGIAELAPERNDLEYPRQQSDSLERTQRDQMQQPHRSSTMGSRERTEGLDHRLDSSLHQSQLGRVQKQRFDEETDAQRLPSSAAALEAERHRQEEERERQRLEREQRIREEHDEKQRLIESQRKEETERREIERMEEDERQRFLRARQHEIETQRRQQAVAEQHAATRRAEALSQAATEEEARQQRRLLDEEEAEEREMEEEIRKRQADELRQSRRISWDQAKQREQDSTTPSSHRTVSSRKKDLYEPFARNTTSREYTGDLAGKKLVGRGSTRQSERTQNGSFVEKTPSGLAMNGVSQSPRSTSAGTQQRTESAREKFESERHRLLAELQERQQMRFELERTREELMKHAKNLQSKTNDRRTRARDLWKKKYFDEKKKTSPFEEQVNKLRGQLNQQHRKLLNQLEGRGPQRKGLPHVAPSKKNDHKILIFKLRHQIDDLKRRVENAKMRLTSEMKLRNQAETELRNLRMDVLQRKITVTVSSSKLKDVDDKPGVRTTPLRGGGAGASFTPRGALKASLK